MAHLDLFLLIDDDINDEVVFLTEVVTLHDIDIGILEALVVEVFLDDNTCTVNHVGSNLITAHNTDFLLQIFSLTFSDTGNIHPGDTRTGCEDDFQIQLLKLHKLKNQYTFKTEQAITTLEFKDVTLNWQ